MLLEELKPTIITTVRRPPDKEEHDRLVDAIIGDRHPVEVSSEEEHFRQPSDEPDGGENPWCPKCFIEGSMKLDDGTCDTCGSDWDEEEEYTEDPLEEAEEDLNEALSILDKWVSFAEDILKMPHTRNRLPLMMDVQMQQLVVDTKTFVKQWPWLDSEV